MTPCDTIQSKLCDRLDDLLSEAEAAAVDLHLGSCDVCRVAMAATTRRRDALFTPFAVAEPPSELPERVRMSFAARHSTAGRVLRYVATFAAGVVATLAVESLAPNNPSPPSAEPPAQVEAPIQDPVISPRPRRIH